MLDTIQTITQPPGNKMFPVLGKIIGIEQEEVKELHKAIEISRYLPFLANSMDLIAVVLLVPVVTRKDATRSWVFVFNTKIYKKIL